MKIIKSLGFVLVVCLLYAGQAAAGFQTCRFPGKGCQGSGFHGKGGHIFRMLKGLDLTETQQEAVKQIQDKYKSDQQNIRTDIRQYRKELTEAIHADDYSEENVRAAHQKLAAEEEEIAVLRGKIISEIKLLLTPEQLEKLKTLTLNRPRPGKAQCPDMNTGRHQNGCRRMMPGRQS